MIYNGTVFNLTSRQAAPKARSGKLFAQHPRRPSKPKEASDSHFVEQNFGCWANLHFITSYLHHQGDRGGGGGAENLSNIVEEVAEVLKLLLFLECP